MNIIFPCNVSWCRSNGRNGWQDRGEKMFYFLLNIILTVVWSLTSQTQESKDGIYTPKCASRIWSFEIFKENLESLSKPQAWIDDIFRCDSNAFIIISPPLPQRNKIIQVSLVCCFVTFNLEFFFIVLFVGTFFSSCKKEKSTLHYQLQNMLSKTACKIYFGENTI